MPAHRRGDSSSLEVQRPPPVSTPIAGRAGSCRCGVKLAAGVTDADVRHLHWLRNQLSDDTVDLLVITTGSNAYRRRDGIAVIPLALLGA